MVGKDIAEKQPESHNDVFADIVNVFLSDGEQKKTFRMQKPFLHTSLKTGSMNRNGMLQNTG